MPAAVLFCPPVRHNQTLDYEGLRKEAEDAIERYTKEPGHTQAGLARELGYTPAYISRAKSEVGPNIAKVQMEIIAHLTEYTIVEEVAVSFRVNRKSDS